MMRLKQLVLNYKRQPKQQQWDTIWRTITSFIIKLDVKQIAGLYTIENSELLLCYHALLDPNQDELTWERIKDTQEHTILYRQLLRVHLHCENNEFTQFQVQIAKHHLLRVMMGHRKLCGFWYLLEAIVLLIEIQLNQYVPRVHIPQQYCSTSPIVVKSNKPNITSKPQVRDYSQERLQQSKKQQLAFHMKSKQSYNVIDNDTPSTLMIKHKKQQNTSQERLHLEPRPNTYVRNYYLSVLMQSPPPKRKMQNTDAIKLDMSKIQPQKMYTVVILKDTDSVDKNNPTSKPMLEECFEMNEESEYQQVVKDIQEHYQIPDSDVTSHRNSVVLALRRGTIENVKSLQTEESIEQRTPKLSDQPQIATPQIHPELHQQLLTQQIPPPAKQFSKRFQDMHMRLSIILGFAQPPKPRVETEPEQIDMLGSLYERGSFAPANRKPRTQQQFEYEPIFRQVQSILPL